MRRVKAKKSIFSSGLTNLNTLNAELLNTSIVSNFMKCGQYYFLLLHQFDRHSQGRQGYQLHPYVPCFGDTVGPADFHITALT